MLQVGAGPTGLAAALTLAQNGVPVRIVDKAPAFHTTSRGSGIQVSTIDFFHWLQEFITLSSQPRTVEVFRFLGILDEARKFHHELPPFQSYKLPGGTEVLKKWHFFDKFKISPDRPWVNRM